MKTRLGIRRTGFRFGAILLLSTSLCVHAATTRYVNKYNASPEPPFSNGWASAALTIQEAIDAAGAGDLILVTNGVYDTGGKTNWPAGCALTNRVTLTNSVTVQAVSTNPADTVIVGAPDMTGGTASNGMAAVRGIFMDQNCRLSGFTVITGYTASAGANAGRFGGGVFMSTNAVIANCNITACMADLYGGGIYAAMSNAIVDCVISFNSLSTNGNYGGGIYCNNGTIQNCTIVSNIVRNGLAQHCWAGGIRADANSIISNCMVLGNSVSNNYKYYAAYGGGGYGGNYYNCQINYNIMKDISGGGGGSAGHQGSYYNCQIVSNTGSFALLSPTLAQDCEIRGNSGGAVSLGIYNRCRIIGNSASGGGALIVSGYTTGCQLFNCLVVSNTSGAWIAMGVNAQNCTIANNTGIGMTDGVGYYGNYFCYMTNCIVYGNSKGNARAGSVTYIGYSCVATSGVACTFIGDHNTTNNPLFVDTNAGNYRLSPGSPCFNAGVALGWMDGAVDLDGRPRVLFGAPDIGAYEYPTRHTGAMIIVK